MCGILFSLNTDSDFVTRLVTLAPRGPDEQHVAVGPEFSMGHTRNCISHPGNGKQGGRQPMEAGDWSVVHNGEIYNADTEHESDSYRILELLQTIDPRLVPSQLDGIFAFVAYNRVTHEFYAARDPVGVIPLYMARSGNSVWVASELKALFGLDNVEIVPPGHIVSLSGCVRYAAEYPKEAPSDVYVPGTLRKLITAAVTKRLKVDVPWGVLLSGGVDSSVVAATIAAADRSGMAWSNLHTFSIGLKNSDDLNWARKMAEHIGSNHHEFVFHPDEGIAILDKVVRAIESYDVTTIRASVPMYILGREVRKLGIKVLFSGEGSDELFGGYKYNQWCPSRQEMHDECVTKMERLHYHDCLRANKTLACHGIECRVPFLDKSLVHFAMHCLDPIHKLSKTHPGGERQTKWLLRQEFLDAMPKQLALRPKVQFSDGVGDGWIDALRKHTESYRTPQRYAYQTPKTKEALLYRRLFDKHFPHGEKTVFYSDETVACSSARGLTWSDSFIKDPSARGL